VLADPARPDTPSQLQRHAAELVRAEYQRCGRSVSLTARALGISRTTVYRHLGEADAAAARRAGAAELA
jgi:sigma-54 dependent transcriptional regulator, acetoin dehydrogenase operon transcriptional activator AcoR